MGYKEIILDPKEQRRPATNAADGRAVAYRLHASSGPTAEPAARSETPDLRHGPDKGAQPVAERVGHVIARLRDELVGQASSLPRAQVDSLHAALCRDRCSAHDRDRPVQVAALGQPCGEPPA